MGFCLFSAFFFFERHYECVDGTIFEVLQHTAVTTLWVLEGARLWPLGASSERPLCLLRALVVFESFLAIWHMMRQAHVVHLRLQTEARHFSKEPSPFRRHGIYNLGPGEGSSFDAKIEASVLAPKRQLTDKSCTVALCSLSFAQSNAK